MNHDEGSYKRLRSPCAIVHSDAGTGDEDVTGCVLADGHPGPHEYKDAHGRAWLWETDFDCDCDHCKLEEGDYCTVYWRKPAAPAASPDKS